MHPHLLQTIFPFLLIITLILIHVPTSLCDDDEQYVNCSKSFQCANVEIGYPFWGQDRPEYCGYPGLELNCEDGVPEITIETLKYRVLEIESTTQTLIVARADYWTDNCPMYLVNTTMDSSLFNYTSTTQELTLYYGCPQIQSTIEGFSSQFNCTINRTEIIGYYATTAMNGFPSALGTSTSSVIVPAFTSEIPAIENIPTANLTEILDHGFGLLWDANNTLCDNCVRSFGHCGHNLSSGEFTCYCWNGSYVDTCRGTPSKTGKKSSVSLPVGLAIGGSAVVVGIIVFLVMICSRRRECLSNKAMVLAKKGKRNDQNIVDAFIRNYGSLAPKQYNYSDVKKMTNSFADKLGQGGFGCVYKGKLFDGRLVAVKVLSDSKGNGEDFINEVASISRTSHVNIVTLLGFCYQRTKRALIYEFMPNGSLDNFIYDRGSSNTNCHLEWNMLYQIALGIARGLEYLHQGCTTRILHFDIKPQNILLNEDFCPKISDFGLAKLCQRKESIVSMLGARGTAGYIAPEVYCRNFGGVSHKSDVYSYGMMVLEMVGGRKNIEVEVVRTSEIYFPHWIYDHIELGEDLKLHGVMTNEEEETVRKMILASLWCIQTNPSNRPSISKVVEMLEGSLQSVQIPPKPYLFSPTRSPQDSSTAS